MQYVAYFIIIFMLVLIISYTYTQLKTNSNKLLIDNMNKYAKEEKIKQQKSSLHGSESKKRKDNKKKRTRMYHL